MIQGGTEKQKTITLKLEHCQN